MTRAGVVAGDVAHEAHLAGLGVDLDDGDVGAERERRRRRRRSGCRSSAASPSGRGQRGEVGPRLRHRRRAGDVERAGVDVEHDVGLGGLERLRRPACLACSTSSIGGLVDGRAALLQRARAHRAAADGHEVGVAPDERRCCSIGMPVWALAIIDHDVSWPWPCGDVPV